MIEEEELVGNGSLDQQTELAIANPDRFTGIATLVYAVEDLPLCHRFLSDWGVIETESNSRGSIWETPIGQKIFLRQYDGDSGVPGLQEIIWGVGDLAALGEIAEDLGKDLELSLDSDGTIHTKDPNGFGVGFSAFTPKEIQSQPQPVNSPGRRERVGEPGTNCKRATPLRLGHVVFQTPFVEAAEKFYRDRLGFWLTDRYPGKAAFLRCAARSDHHNIAFFRTNVTEPHFEHAAFEVCDIHEVFGGGLYIKDKGWQTQFGPGRHATSCAYFWYFQNPCGGNIEYFADNDFADETWSPRDIPPSPTSIAEWGMFDGISRFSGKTKAWIRPLER
ncbi:MAG: VOC family protein [Arenicellaceae bacterium]|nr:VOC family protein [Arenicellaceae bacterium]